MVKAEQFYHNDNDRPKRFVMLRRELFVLLFATGFLLSGESFLSAAEDVLPPGDQTPVLRLETGGARSNVNSLAFSPDGRYLYAQWHLLWNSFE